MKKQKNKTNLSAGVTALLFEAQPWGPFRRKPKSEHTDHVKQCADHLTYYPCIPNILNI